MSTLNVNALNITEKLKLPTYTTTQRDALTPEVGLLIYNSTEETVEIYDGTEWGAATGQPLIQFSKTFNYTGQIQSFVVPAETVEVTAYIWGPGGGSEADTNTRGGAGGYTAGTINTTNGGTLKIVVGGGGGPGTQNNGSGGGYSGVFTSSWGGTNEGTDHGASILIAGGGGGAANSSTGSNHGGGAGGGLSGQKGNPSGSGGNGGSQTGGGSYSQTGGGSCTGGTQCSGNTLRGGVACGGAQTGAAVGWPGRIYGGNWGSAAGGNGCNAGGGGAGYYGGAGGGGSPNGGNGGGGSGYVGGHPSYPVSNANTYTGNGQTPASEATGSSFYTNGIAQGGTYNQNVGNNGNHIGGHGMVVFVYSAIAAVN